MRTCHRWETNPKRLHIASAAVQITVAAAVEMPLRAFPWAFHQSAYAKPALNGSANI